MLIEYLKAAMRKAHYEFLDEHEGFCGEIPGFDGIVAQASTLEECRDELASVLEDWLLFRISRRLPIPSVDGMTLEIKEVAAA
jgi:predicted RNase H-like HicB family nuclease